MRALITGAGGFVGGHLVADLARAGWDVAGSGIAPLSPSWHEHAGGASTARGRFFEADITDRSAMRRILDEFRPDSVFHLAGIASVSAAEREPEEALRVNAGGALALLAEVVGYRERTGVDPTCLIVGSAEQYGHHVEGEMPLAEEAHQRPATAYAASKCAQEVIALQMHRANALRVVCARSFNHSGAGQRNDFLLPSLVTRSLELRRKGGTLLAVGSTSAVRDFLHVEDVARAYRLLVESGRPGEVYNVCSGTGWSVEQLASAVLRRVGVNAELTVQRDLVRRVDVPVLIGSHAKLTRDTGWVPAKGMNDILEDLIVAASN